MTVLDNLPRDEHRHLEVEGQEVVLKGRAVTLTEKPAHKAGRVFLLSLFIEGVTCQRGHLGGVHNHGLVAKVLNQLDGHI